MLEAKFRVCPRIALAACAAVLAAFARSLPADAAAKTFCSDASLLSLAAGSSDISSPCTIAPGSILLEGLYYQNASFVGGTALAAYPLFNLRLGFAPNAELIIDPPSQVAESGARGLGLYPVSRPGYGAQYTFAQTVGSAWAAGINVVPPASLYAPSESQPKYQLDLTTQSRLSRSIALTSTVAAQTSHSAGFGTILPTAALGAEFTPVARTMLSADVGTRLVTRRSASQSFADLSLAQLLGRKVAWTIGLGTAFNPVANAKPHYLSTGLAFRP